MRLENIYLQEVRYNYLLKAFNYLTSFIYMPYSVRTFRFESQGSVKVYKHVRHYPIAFPLFRQQDKSVLSEDPSLMVHDVVYIGIYVSQKTTS
jgi:hypothetical protein